MRQPRRRAALGAAPSFRALTLALAALGPSAGCSRSPPPRENVAPTAGSSPAGAPSAPAPRPAPAAPTAATPPDAAAAASDASATAAAAAHDAPPPEASDATAAVAEPAAETQGPAGGDSAPEQWTGFLGGSDAPILRRVCNGAIARMQRNTGGSTISFRVWFDGGARGLLKPQQTNSVANFRAELAAYRLSRLLGLHRVPPACGRVASRAELQRTADASGDAQFSERVMREVLGRGNDVPAAVLHWVPGPLEPVPGTDRWPQLLDADQPLAPADVPLAADLARLILWDFVIDNVDRWSGGNILRQHLRGQDPSPMLFMDNGAAFSAGNNGLGARPREQAARLARVERLPRAMLAALRALTAESIAAAMREDPLGRVLGEGQINALLTRRDRVVAHADALIQTRGEAAVLVFP